MLVTVITVVHSCLASCVTVHRPGQILLLAIYANYKENRILLLFWFPRQVSLIT